VTASDIHRAIDAVWRIESAKIIAALARMLRDVGLAGASAAFSRVSRGQKNAGDSIHHSVKTERRTSRILRTIGKRIEPRAGAWQSTIHEHRLALVVDGLAEGNFHAEGH